MSKGKASVQRKSEPIGGQLQTSIRSFGRIGQAHRQHFVDHVRNGLTVGKLEQAAIQFVRGAKDRQIL